VFLNYNLLIYLKNTCKLEWNKKQLKKDIKHIGYILLKNKIWSLLKDLVLFTDLMF